MYGSELQWSRSGLFPASTHCAARRLKSIFCHWNRCGPLHRLALSGIDWVIVGGESGHHHRAVQLEWVRDIRDQCVRADVAFFFKQVGGRTPKAGGRMLDGRTWDQMPTTRVALAA